ncbi:MAG: dUTP diphosphatase [Clostridiales bacterium]|nr:dUTP diphosphatase [Clostridiales bacterium]
MDSIKFKKVREQAVIPVRATEGSAGLDLRACIDSPVTLSPNEPAMLPTGLAIALPSQNMAAMIFARSGLAVKHGVALSNGVGVVDSDYRGEICVGLVNLSKEPYTIQPQERVAQLIVMPVYALPVEEADELPETARGNGGFGSTGRL